MRLIAILIFMYQRYIFLLKLMVNGGIKIVTSMRPKMMMLIYMDI